jgi:hypothetical protein
MHFNSPPQAPHALPTSSTAALVSVQIMLPLIMSFSRKTKEAVHAQSPSVIADFRCDDLSSFPGRITVLSPRLHRTFTKIEFLHFLILNFPGVCRFGKNNSQSVLAGFKYRVREYSSRSLDLYRNLIPCYRQTPTKCLSMIMQSHNHENELAYFNSSTSCRDF